MSQHLFLKVTTIPCQRAGLLEELRANVTAPAKLSNADSIKKWLEENRDAAAQEALLKTAYDGSLGEVIAIAWAVDNEDVRYLSRSLEESEGVLIERFFDELLPLNVVPRMVGHNILGFDLRFLFQRAVILSLEPPFDLGHDNRYNCSRVYDVMVAWAGFNRFLSLPDLARAIGFRAPTTLTLAETWTNVKAGDAALVADLCADEVRTIRSIFHAMTFSKFYAGGDHAEG